MQYGFIIPGGDLQTIVELAHVTVAVGWDGVFYWDAMYIKEAGTLAHLSNGRLVLPGGLGVLDDGGFAKVGEATDRKLRAELLDESLDILSGLWSGQPFSFDGKHYHMEEMTFLPPPVQKPIIPIWVVGAWPSMKSMRRVLRYDGLLPAKLNADGSFADITP